MKFAIVLITVFFLFLSGLVVAIIGLHDDYKERVKIEKEYCESKGLVWYKPHKSKSMCVESHNIISIKVGK